MLSSLNPSQLGTLVSLPIGFWNQAGGLGTALATSLSTQDLLAGQAETLRSQLPLLWAAR